MERQTVPDKVAAEMGRDDMACLRESLARVEADSEPFKRFVRSLATAPTVASTTDVI